MMATSDPPFPHLTLPHERALVRVLIMAQRRRLSSAVMVDRLANEFTRWPAAALRQVARLLADGAPLIDALEQTPRALDPTAVMALRLAIETGTFPQRLESLIAGDPTSMVAKKNRRDDIESQLFEMMIGFLSTWLVLMFLLVFITPTIEKMYEEFEMALPAPMMLLTSIGGYLAQGWGLLIWLLLFLLMLGVMAYNRTAWALGFRRRSPYSRADVLTLLAWVARSRRPLAAGVSTLARVHPVGRFRRRLASVADAMDGGTDGWQALAENKFLTIRDAHALQLAGDPLAQAWLLRRAARSRRYLSDSRAGLILQTIYLVSLLLLAAIVMLAAVGMFMSVYGLVDGVALMGAIR